MYNIIMSNFQRLFKSRLFYSCLLGMVVFSVFIFWLQYDRLFKQEVEIVPLLFSSCSILGFLQALFICLFFGMDFQDGTLRNKIMIGHNRPSIYLANVIVSFVAGLLFLMASLLSMLILVVLFIHPEDISMVSFLIMCLLSVLLTASYTAIFVCILMMSADRTHSVVLSLLFMILTVGGTLYILNTLYEPELTNALVIENGQNIMKLIPNPKYATGMKRAMLTFLRDFLPASQGFSISGLAEGNPICMGGYALFLAILPSVVGMWFFKKKDLK